MNKSITTTIVLAVIVGAIAFYGGMVFGQSKTKTVATTGGAGQFAGGAGGGFAGRGGRGGAGGAGFVGGQILSKDASSITVKLPGTAGTKIIFYSGTTQINKPAPILAADLNVGDNITVAGTPNPDGSETAATIQVRPAMQASSTPSSGAVPTQGQ